jgi:hypothetical protein
MNTTTIGDSLAALGRDAPDERSLGCLVRTITGRADAVPASARIEPVDYEIGTPSTEELLRVVGTARLADGEAVEWSTFIKKLRSARHWPHIHLVPEPVREQFVQNLPWQLEVAVHRSNIASLLPEGLRLPTMYRIGEYDDDRATGVLGQLGRVFCCSQRSIGTAVRPTAANHGRCPNDRMTFVYQPMHEGCRHPVGGYA